MENKITLLSYFFYYMNSCLIILYSMNSELDDKLRQIRIEDFMNYEILGEF